MIIVKPDAQVVSISPLPSIGNLAELSDELSTSYYRESDTQDIDIDEMARELTLKLYHQGYIYFYQVENAIKEYLLERMK